ncbi:hypothetical protein EXIGLDRAFT_830882 [Exidia glandulosa HHB12029]|uniref:F-box domain-containing protein n=1 Tax=Exidia glandulosa HHB12029 TaxID=1314781 RepID=A0A166BE07_EXIGL|nr:hypothetical protein EXIGLDRAFT_830882 [Exidia glandulosa HHB12029]
MPADTDKAKRDVQSAISDRIQTALSTSVACMLPYVKNLERFTFIRAETAAQDAARLLTLTALGNLYGRQTQHLCLHDASLRDNGEIFSLFTSLKTLELGYSDVAAKDVASILRNNAATLEDVRFNWVSTMPQNSLFVGVVASAPLPKLRALHITGQVKVAVNETFQFLEACPALRALHIDDLEDAGALNWAKVLDRLVDACARRTMDALSFGGPKTTCTVWWQSVARFLDHLDDTLESLVIHARQIGTRAGTVSDMPEALEKSCMHSDGHYPNLKSLVIIWRAVWGMDYATIGRLANVFPNLEFLHCYIVHPRPCTIDELIENVAMFQKLKHLHFVSPAGDTNTEAFRQPENLPPSLAGLHIAGPDYPWAPYFLAAVVTQCPSLTRVSWIRHEPWREEKEDCLFVHVHRDKCGNPTKCESIVQTHYTCTAKQQIFFYKVRGDTTLALAQPPSWSEDMGQKPVKEGSVCQRACIGRNVGYDGAKATRV